MRSERTPSSDRHSPDHTAPVENAVSPNALPTNETPGRAPWWMTLILVLIVPATLAVGFHLGRQMLGMGYAQQTERLQPVSVEAEEDEKYKPVTELPPDLFKGWGTPEMALVITGQTFGYVQPCGCSSPQYGGLVRRYNVIKMLEKKGWQIASIDLGDIYPPNVEIPEQAKEKFKTILRAMEKMHYQDFGVGFNELRMPFIDGLVEAFALQLKQPRPVSLDLKDPNKQFESLSLRSYDVIKGSVRVGVSSIAAPSVVDAVKGDAALSFFQTKDMIPLLLQRMKAEKTDVVILFLSTAKADGKIAGGNPLPPGAREEAEATEVAKIVADVRAKDPTLPNVDLIIHSSELDTPPSRPQLIEGTNTYSLIMGHKGKYLGVLGIFKKAPGGFELKYELVSLGPQFGVPKGQEKGHPIVQLMTEYSQTVKDRDFLKLNDRNRRQHPTQTSPVLENAGVKAHYVGTEVCAGCHDDAYKVWKTTGHSHAFETLEKYGDPAPLRIYDPECIVCHTVGFKYDTGYYDPPANAKPAKVEAHNFKLRNVGCESCHGPGSMHANNPDNKVFYPLINPIKIAGQPQNELKLDIFCQSCHDIENDVHWGQKKPFQESWKKIAHPRKKDN